MKKSLLFFVVCLFFATDTHAQKSKMNSANRNLVDYKSVTFDVKDLIDAYDNIEEAITHEETVILPKAWYIRGEIMVQLSAFADSLDYAKNAIEEALISYEKVIELEKDAKKKKKSGDAQEKICTLSGSFYNQGSSNFEAKNYATAIKNFELAARVLENDKCKKDDAEKQEGFITVDDAYFAGGLSAYKGGIDDKAIEMYTKLFDKEYDDVNVYSILANLHRKAGNDEKANEVIAVGRKKYPENKALMIEEVNALLSGDDPSKAIASMKEAIAMDGENATLHFALGSAYDQIKEFDNAEASYKKAIEVDPTFFNAYYNLGTIFYNQAATQTEALNNLPATASDQEYNSLKNEVDNLFTKALPYFEKAHELDATEKNTMIALKEIYARQQNYEKMKEINNKLGQ